LELCFFPKNSSYEKFPGIKLILNPDGSLYHIKLKPEDVAETVILVGDQQRVL
jgi:uridine phosphorylase